jgi:hypothetical protein
MMSPMSSNILREFEIAVDDFPQNQVPADLKVTAPRGGGPIRLQVRLEFIDADGAAVTGGTVDAPSNGSATVDWYGIKFMDPDLNIAAKAYPFPLIEQPPVKTSISTANLGMNGGVDMVINQRSDAWPWPVITAIAPPTQYGKVIVVTLPELTPDGMYSIARDEEDPVEVDAVSQGFDAIMAELAAGFDADEVVTVAQNLDERTLTFTCEVGETFELALVSPGDAMTQEDIELPDATGIAVAARMYAHVLGPIID